MALNVIINGLPYDKFTSASVAASIAAVSRGFSFVSTADEQGSFPLKVGDNVEITADGLTLLEGFIETLEVDYDSSNHSIRINGRSKLMDLIDSTVPTQFEYSGTTLEAIATTLLSSIGIDAKVINEAGNIRDFGDDITSAEIGQNALEFLEKYSRKRQVLLTTDGSNGLVLARTSDVYAPLMLKNVRGATDNNILRANLRIDNAKRFNSYLVKAQLNPLNSFFDKPPKTVSDQEGVVYDTDIRSSRKLELNSEESTDSFSAGDRATWEKNVRIGSAFNYRATIVGHTIKNKLILPNRLIRVVDNFAQIDATLLIKEVQYDFDIFSGSLTTLTMIKKESFTLALEQSQREANSKKTDKGFVI